MFKSTKKQTFFSSQNPTDDQLYSKLVTLGHPNLEDSLEEDGISKIIFNKPYTVLTEQESEIFNRIAERYKQELIQLIEKTFQESEPLMYIDPTNANGRRGSMEPSAIQFIESSKHTTSGCTCTML